VYEKLLGRQRIQVGVKRKRDGGGKSHKKKASGGGTIMGSCIKASTTTESCDILPPHRWPHQHQRAVSANSMVEKWSAPDKPQHSDLHGTN
jgi:hypothetical protein